MPTAIAAATPTNEQRLEALELFMQHLLLVIECEPRLSAEKLDRWLDMARARMRKTDSVKPGTEAALARLQQVVLA